MYELPLVDDFCLRHCPSDSRVVEPKHCRWLLNGVFDVVAVLKTWTLGTQALDNCYEKHFVWIENSLNWVTTFSPLFITMHFKPALLHCSSVSESYERIAKETKSSKELLHLRINHHTFSFVEERQAIAKLSKLSHPTIQSAQIFRVNEGEIGESWFVFKFAFSLEHKKFSRNFLSFNHHWDECKRDVTFLLGIFVCYLLQARR